MLNLKHLGYIETQDPRVAETFRSIQNELNLIATQTGTSGTPLSAPPSIAAITVTGGNGDASVLITDPAGQAQPNLGLHYFCDYSTDPAFGSYTTKDMGPSRGEIIRVGSGTFYFRGYSQFRNSALSPKVTFGNPATGVNTAAGVTPAPPNAGSGAGGGGGGYGGGGSQRTTK